MLNKLVILIKMFIIGGKEMYEVRLRSVRPIVCLVCVGVWVGYLAADGNLS